MNYIEAIKIHLEENLESSEILIIDESNSHANHFDKENESLPSHLYIKIISDSFQSMNLLSRHRKINNLMKIFFDKGLHALRIDAYTKSELSA